MACNFADTMEAERLQIVHYVSRGGGAGEAVAGLFIWGHTGSSAVNHESSATAQEVTVAGSPAHQPRDTPATPGSHANVRSGSLLEREREHERARLSSHLK